MKVYAVIKSGAHQYKATVGSNLIVERLPHEVGAQIELNEVFLLDDGEDVTVGQPTVEGAIVRATIVEEFRGPKIRIFKYKPKERYRRRQGHRQTYMRLRVDDIVKGVEDNGTEEG
jgi:large subunit ribosomal protein L21